MFAAHQGDRVCFLVIIDRACSCSCFGLWDNPTLRTDVEFVRKLWLEVVSRVKNQVESIAAISYIKKGLIQFVIYDKFIEYHGTPVLESLEF